jgi:hypothetical protein
VSTSRDNSLLSLSSLIRSWELTFRRRCRYDYDIPSHFFLHLTTLIFFFSFFLLTLFITDILERYLRETEADLIFLPHTADTHPTHRAVVQVTLRAFHRIFTSPNPPYPKVDLYFYEGPWSIFPPNTYNTICSPPSDYFTIKMQAISKHSSQVGRTRYDVASESLARLRASLVPEQDLAGFGSEPPPLEERVELFVHRSVSTGDEVQELLRMFDQREIPHRT